MSTNTQSRPAPRSASRPSRAEKAQRKDRASRRTTITLSPESQEIVERFKSASGTSTSAAIDRIIQRSEPKPSRLKEVNGFLVLDVPAKHPPVHFTVEDLKQLEDDMDREYLERFMPRKKKPTPSRNVKGRRQ
jgi:hypothetical protein